MEGTCVFPRLSQLCQVRQLKDAVQYNLFPSADMILSMNKEYGTYAEHWEQKAGADTEVDMMPTLPIQMKRYAALNTLNREYTKWKRSSQQLALRQCKNYIQVSRLKLF